MAVDTLSHLMTVRVTPAEKQERAGAAAMPRRAAGHRPFGATGWAGQGHTGETTSKAAQDNGTDLQIVKLPEAKKGFELLPRRWVVETEAIIMESGLEWVLVRPSVLNDKAAGPTVRALVNLSDFHGGTIARVDVARFMLDQLQSDTWPHRSPLITW